LHANGLDNPFLGPLAYLAFGSPTGETFASKLAVTGDASLTRRQAMLSHPNVTVLSQPWRAESEQTLGTTAPGSCETVAKTDGVGGRASPRAAFGARPPHFFTASGVRGVVSPGWIL